MDFPPISSRNFHQAANNKKPAPLKQKVRREGSYFRQLARELIHGSEDISVIPRSKAPERLSSARSILQYNRRVISPAKIASELNSEFEDAQKHLRECPAYPSQWRHANPEKCIEPVSIETESNAGIAHMQGTRPTMEDTHISTTLTLNFNNRTYYFPLYGIFDGHGGADCAKFLEDHIASYLTTRLDQVLTGSASPEIEEAAIFNLLKLAFVELGAEYQKLRGEGGSTANIAIIINNTLWVANVGDTRAILVRNGKAIALSEDAKPGLEKYKRDVENRHATVFEINGIARVQGNLATARAVGHHEITSGINPRAKIIKYDLAQLTKAERAFLVIACDGLWDVASSNQVAHTMKGMAKKSAAEIASILVRKGYEAGSQDNISALVVPLQNQIYPT